MKYIDEFRDRHLVTNLATEIRKAVDPERAYRFMEVCGSHTMSIFRFGIRNLLPKNVKLVSGPGCPVCVTPNGYLDKAIALAALPNVIITTFGDMMRVPGSYSSLEKEKAAGRDIRMVYSTLDALEIAKKNTGKEVVFLGVGFETTIPTIAMSILSAKKEKIKNYSVLSGHKTMPEPLRALAGDKSLAIDGFILPGHVSAIIGVKPYSFLAGSFKKRCVIAGFETVDILQSVLMLLKQKVPKVDVQYTRIIEAQGNKKAKDAIKRVFVKATVEWRGIGNIKGSGLKIRRAYAAFDAEKKFKVTVKPPREDAGCACGDVLKGKIIPTDCRLFAKVCTPAHPIGSCMVSSEGACAAYFKYGGAGRI